MHMYQTKLFVLGILAEGWRLHDFVLWNSDISDMLRSPNQPASQRMYGNTGKIPLTALAAQDSVTVGVGGENAEV